MFEPYEEIEDCKLYRWRTMMLAVHWREFRKEHFELIGRACAAIEDEHGMMSSIVVLRGNFRLTLDYDARQAAADLTAQCEPFNIGQALVIEADGFKASIARSLLTGVNLIARSKAQQRTFKDPKEGIHWLCEIERQPDEVRAAAGDAWASIDGILHGLPAKAVGV